MTPNPSTSRFRSNSTSASSSQAASSGRSPSARPADRDQAPSSPPAAGQNADAASKAPIQRLRLGRIHASIWENGSGDRKFYGVRFTRSYQDEAKNYHDTDSFGRDDLLVLAKLADRAHSFIFDRLAELRTDSRAEA